MSEVVAIICDGSKQDLLDLEVAKMVSEELTRHYPGHMWAVNAQSEHGVVTVKNLNLSGNRGFLLHYRNMKSFDDLKRNAMRAGGEILERYMLTRGELRINELRGLQRDMPGRFAYAKQ